jgi:hypothetical protein
MTWLSRAFSGFVRFLSLAWFGSLLEFFRVFFRCGRRDRRDENERDRNRSPYPCVPINRPEMLRPDPLIYSQYFLMAQGCHVTWDNPDIVLKKDGKVVSSSSLEKNTPYEVVAQIWNASFSCPVVSMPVYFSFLKFGVGTVSVPIGKKHVDLGVKGGPGCPAFVSMEWITPREEGHYCLQVHLAPADDLNFDNNLGQENTNVGTAHSPANFEFHLRNASRTEEQFRFKVDAYTIPAPDPCERREEVPASRRREDWPRVDFQQQGFRPRAPLNQSRIQRHLLGSHPLPPGWEVTISPPAPLLAPGDEIPVEVVIFPPDDFHGSRAINVNAFNRDGLAGGVTLIVVRH